MKFYVNWSKSWDMFNFCHSCRCQRFQIPVTSYLSFPLTLGSAKTFQRDSVSCSAFIYNPLLLFWSSVDVVRNHGKRVAFYNLSVKSPFFSGILSLDFHRCFIAVPPFLERQEGARAGRNVLHAGEIRPWESFSLCRFVIC